MAKGNQDLNLSIKIDAQSALAIIKDLVEQTKILTSDLLNLGSSTSTLASANTNLSNSFKTVSNEVDETVTKQKEATAQIGYLKAQMELLKKEVLDGSMSLSRFNEMAIPLSQQMRSLSTDAQTAASTNNYLSSTFEGVVKASSDTSKQTLEYRTSVRNAGKELKELLAQLRTSEIAHRSNKITTAEYNVVLEKLEPKLRATAISTEQVAQVESKLFFTHQRLKTGFVSMSDAMQKNLEVAKQSRAALLSVSQAIQDAPYGIRGMSNNIDFLVQQFLALRVAAGGTSAALKSMWAGLGTASGVLIAFSAISAIVNYFTNVKNSANEAKEAIDAYKESMGILGMSEDEVDRQEKILKKAETELKARERDLELGVKTYTDLKDMGGGVFVETTISTKEAIKNLQEIIIGIKSKLNYNTQLLALEAQVNKIGKDRGKISKDELALAEKKFGIDGKDKDLLIGKFNLRKFNLEKELQTAISQKREMEIKNEILEIDKKIIDLNKKDEKTTKSNTETQKERARAIHDALIDSKNAGDEEETNKQHLKKLQEERNRLLEKHKATNLDNLKIKVAEKDITEEEFRDAMRVAELDKDILVLNRTIAKEKIADEKRIKNEWKESLKIREQALDAEYQNREINKETYLLRLNQVLAELDTVDTLGEYYKLKKKVARLDKEDDFIVLLQEGMETSLTSQFNGLLSQLDIFTDKLGLAEITFKSFASSIINELIRITLKALVLNAVMAIFNSLTGGGSSALGAISQTTSGLIGNPFADTLGLGGGGVDAIIPKASGGYINEPVVGMGKSGRMYSFAEKGSELVIPNNRLANNMVRANMASNQPINVVVQGKIKGRDIYLSNLREGYQISRLSY